MSFVFPFEFIAKIQERMMKNQFKYYFINFQDLRYFEDFNMIYMYKDSQTCNMVAI